MTGLWSEPVVRRKTLLGRKVLKSVVPEPLCGQRLSTQVGSTENPH
jgi:hypothetical protein